MSVSHVKYVRFKRSVVTNITGIWPSTDESISHVYMYMYSSYTFSL